MCGDAPKTITAKWFNIFCQTNPVKYVFDKNVKVFLCPYICVLCDALPKHEIVKLENNSNLPEWNSKHGFILYNFLLPFIETLSEIVSLRHHQKILLRYFGRFLWEYHNFLIRYFNQNKTWHSTLSSRENLTNSLACKRSASYNNPNSKTPKRLLANFGKKIFQINDTLGATKSWIFPDSRLHGPMGG